MTTQYTPKYDHRLTLAMDAGRLAVQKDGVKHPLDGGSAAYAVLVQCDPNAQSLAVGAERDLNDGTALVQAGIVIEIFVTPLGLILVSMGQSQVERGLAATIDAMNRHNDVTDCRQGPSPAAARN
jgi:hypothetical protein